MSEGTSRLTQAVSYRIIKDSSPSTCIPPLVPASGGSPPLSAMDENLSWKKKSNRMKITTPTLSRATKANPPPLTGCKNEKHGLHEYLVMCDSVDSSQAFHTVTATGSKEIASTSGKICFSQKFSTRASGLPENDSRDRQNHCHITHEQSPKNSTGYRLGSSKSSMPESFASMSTLGNQIPLYSLYPFLKATTFELYCPGLLIGPILLTKGRQ